MTSILEWTLIWSVIALAALALFSDPIVTIYQ